MGRIFVSYSRKDERTVRPLVDALRKDGHDVFMDIELPGGHLWREKIVAAIAAAEVFALFLSPRSVESDEVRSELDIAADEKKPIAPVLIERVTIPARMRYPLAGLQTIDLTADAGGADRLRKEIRSLVGSKLRAASSQAAKDGLAAILPGQWNVAVASTGGGSLHQRDDVFLFNIIATGVFGARQISSAATIAAGALSEPLAGAWIIESNSSVRFEHYPAGSTRKKSFTFALEVIAADQLRGSTDMIGRRKRAVWRRA